MGRKIIACGVIFLFLLQSWSTVEYELPNVEYSNTTHQDNLFNQTGFTEDGVYTDSNGDVRITKPHIQWTSSTSTIITRTAACSVAIDSLNEVWVMGGREDPNPTQPNDESATNFIEVFDNTNKTWDVHDNLLPLEQEYCEAEMVDDLILVIGDWPRNSNPPEYPWGLVQIYNVSNDTWYSGTNMLEERGLGAMAESGGYLYYAGGIRNQSANDASNVTLRYDPKNDSWSRMADMNHARASFELVNYHGQLYAMGGFQGTQTWNRQALNYVERYDPSTDTWTNLTSLPVAMFGWSGTVYNDEIVLVGGYNGGVRNSVYHWNPIEDTWSKGNNIAPSGHFDVIVEEINGSIIWATGDKSSTPYSSWGQTFSDNFQFQDRINPHTAWLTSPVIDLRPNPQSHAIPVQINLSGETFTSGDLRFQYRTSSTPNTISSNLWQGPDGTINTTFSRGITNLNIPDRADYMQYRIQFTIDDLENWVEPSLDSMSIVANHAGFTPIVPNTINPYSEPAIIQTTHDMISEGEMYLELAKCDSFGAIQSDWSKLSYDGTTMLEEDSANLLFSNSVELNLSTQQEKILNWSIVFDNLGSASHVCLKAGSEGVNNVEYIHNNPVEIDNEIAININEIYGINEYNSTVGGVNISLELDFEFPSTSKTLSAGEIQARANFNIQEINAEQNIVLGWNNQTTPWQSLNIEDSSIINWTLPSDISGIVYITVEGISNGSLQILTNSTPIIVNLDNSNPVLLSTYPESGTYIDSEVDRKISMLIGDLSGYDLENVKMQTWVQNIDDGSDGSIPDNIPQNTEYSDINFTLENSGSFWWFNTTQSDDINEDKQLVYVRIVGDDLAGLETLNSTIWWKSRDAKLSTVERIYNHNSNQYWEVLKEISWDIVITDDNDLSDIISVEVQFGGDSEFGIKYEVSDKFCNSLGLNVDIYRSSCNHSISGDEMVFSVSIYSDWGIDISTLSEGLVEIEIKDIDGISVSTFENLWIYSDNFDISITQILDESGSVQGEVTNDSIVQIGDEIRITGQMTYALSGEPYDGELSLSWWGNLQGENWFGSSAIEVFAGQFNTTIAMPSNGGIMDFEITFKDPFNTRVIGEYEIPVFQVDAFSPLILDSSIEQLSRYHLNKVGIGVNIVEETAWTGELEITCQVDSTEITWDPITISLEPNNFLQGKTIFSFNFDFSSQGDPSTLSPEAQLDCWAQGSDDSGWPLTFSEDLPDGQPWLTIPLSSDGPNIELVGVDLQGVIEPGKELRAEITVKNTGEDLEEPFNITVYTVSGGEENLVGRYSQTSIPSGEGIVKRVSIIVPDGDWEVLVIVDEEQEIWELNEDDNTFSKSYSTPEETGAMVYILSGTGLFAVILVIIVLRKRSRSEISEAKKQPSIEELPRSGPPQGSRNISLETKPNPKPKKGPPPKTKAAEPAAVTNVADAMAKLSLDTLPGNENFAKTTVPSYESLPAGGDYEYLNEGTFYTGNGIGKWKLEDDGSFTKIE